MFFFERLKKLLLVGIPDHNESPIKSNKKDNNSLVGNKIMYNCLSLYDCVSNNDLKSARNLLSNGESPHTKYNGKTIINHAIKLNRLEMIDLFFQHGGKIDIEDEKLEKRVNLYNFKSEPLNSIRRCIDNDQYSMAHLIMKNTYESESILCEYLNDACKNSDNKFAEFLINNGVSGNGDTLLFALQNNMLSTCMKLINQKTFKITRKCLIKAIHIAIENRYGNLITDILKIEKYRNLCQYIFPDILLKAINSCNNEIVTVLMSCGLKIPKNRYYQLINLSCHKGFLNVVEFLYTAELNVIEPIRIANDNCHVQIVKFLCNKISQQIDLDNVGTF